MSVKSYLGRVETIKMSGVASPPEYTYIKSFGSVFSAGAESVTEKGNVCSISIAPSEVLAPENTLVNTASKYLALDVLRIAPNLFFRVQNVSVVEKSLKQIRQTFGGAVAGVYGGGISQITVTGVTKVWSGLCQENGVGAANTEMDALHQFMNAIANARGAIFKLHDGMRAQAWLVIPVGITTSKNVQHNNLESYEVEFMGASFDQKLKHIEKAGSNLYRFSGVSSSGLKRTT